MPLHQEEVAGSLLGHCQTDILKPKFPMKYWAVYSKINLFRVFPVKTITQLNLDN